MSKINKDNLTMIMLMLTVMLVASNTISAEDTVPPKLLADEDKPVKFDSKTRELTLDFDEPIDAVPATDVNLDKIYIMNYRFDEDGNVVIDAAMTLTGATVTEGYGTIVTITLTGDQRDVLKGDHPQLYLDAGAVKDIAGNDNLASAAVNVHVTPPLLSGVETVYDGDQFYYPDNPGTLVPFDLIFTEELSTDVNVTKITITNEKDEAPFNLTSSEFDTIVVDENGIARIVRFELSKSHRDKISYWQASEMEELHVKLDEGAVVDIYDAPNELMTESERIDWDKDNYGPALTNSSTYNSITRLLRLRFNENLDLTPEAPETLDDLVDSTRITLSSPVTGDSFRLTNDELVPDQDDDWWLEYTLTSAHNDEISSWRADGATQINIRVEVGAVRDINENAAVLCSRHITAANWTKDTVRPTFVAAYYSVELRTLVIRFSESISNATGLKPDLDLIKVHAAGKTPVALGTDTYEVSGEALKIEGLSDNAHEAIADVANPQVDIASGAVYDLAGNAIFAISNRSIMYDVSGPELSTTGNTYEHIFDENEYPPNQGLLTLSFKEVIDVSTTDLAKIKLAAGTNSVDLGGAEVLTETNAETIEIKITDDVTVGEIVSWQDDYDTLFVELEEGAIRDLFGQANAAIMQALNLWIKKIPPPLVPVPDRVSEQKPIYGLNGKFYDSPEDVRSLEDAERVIAEQEPLPFGPVGPIDFPVGMQKVQWEHEGDPFGLGEKGYNYVVVFHGYIYSPTAGEVHFAIGSDDGCRLTIAGQTVLEYPGIRDFEYREGTATFEESGWYPIEIIMFQYRGDHGIEFRSNLTVDGDYGDPSELPLVPSVFLSPIVPKRGDMSGDGTISALDAALILQYVVGLIDKFPVDWFTAPSSATPRNYTVSMPNLRAHSSSYVRVPVQIEDATDLTAGGFRIAFDSTRLRPTAMVSSPLLSDYHIKYNLQLRGEVRVAFAGLPKAKKGGTSRRRRGGTLFYLEFDVLGKQDDNPIPLRFASVELANSLDVFMRDGAIEILPEKTVLLPNYPNPFNPETWLPYELAKDATVTIRIYDVKGQVVRQLNIGKQEAGRYIDKKRAAYWDGKDGLGQAVSSGLYFYTLKAGDFQAIKRMVIVK